MLVYKALGLLVLSQNRLFVAEHNKQIDNPANEKHKTRIKVESVEYRARVWLYYANLSQFKVTVHCAVCVHID